MSILDEHMNDDPLQKLCCKNCFWMKSKDGQFTCNKHRENGSDHDEFVNIKDPDNVRCLRFLNKHIKQCGMCVHFFEGQFEYVKDEIGDTNNNTTLPYHYCRTDICKHCNNSEVIIHDEEYKIVYQRVLQWNSVCEKFECINDLLL